VVVLTMDETLDEVDLRTTAEIEAKRGTLEPLDEAALQAARPESVEIPASHVFEKDKICKYCASLLAARDGGVVQGGRSRALAALADVKVATADGRTWAVGKRYSEFKALRDGLTKLAPSIGQLPFPKKTWSSGIGNATVATRTEALRQWTNEVTKMLAEDVAIEREVCLFLAQDDSLDDLEQDPEARARVLDALGEFASPTSARSLVTESIRDAWSAGIAADEPLLSPASQMQLAMTDGTLSFADVTSPRKSSMGGSDDLLGQAAYPPSSSWPEGDPGPASGGAVSVEVIGSEEGRIDPATGTWQRNEGKGSRHVRYVLQVSAHGHTIVVRRRWRQIVAFSAELQKLSKGWIEPHHPEDRWHESNKIKSGWRNPGFNEKKIAARRDVLSAFFKAFSAWATRLATKEDQRVDFFDPDVHPRLQSIKSFLLGADSLENDSPLPDSPDAQSASATAGSAGGLDASVEVGDLNPSGTTQAADEQPVAKLAIVQEATTDGMVDTVTMPANQLDSANGTIPAEPKPQPTAPLANTAPVSELDVTVEANNVRSC
jgi:hypothetical protein